MRTLMTVLAVLVVSATAVGYDDACGGRYNGYPGWAQDAFCKPSPGG
jgi:hypothetical protein